MGENSGSDVSEVLFPARVSEIVFKSCTNMMYWKEILPGTTSRAPLSHRFMKRMQKENEGVDRQLAKPLERNTDEKQDDMSSEDDDNEAS